VSGSSSKKLYGKRGKSAVKLTHPNPKYDGDDVFSPRSAAVRDTSSLFDRLSLDETPTKTSGKLPMSSKASGKLPISSNQTTDLVELRPLRSVAFKDEDETVSTTTSPAAKLSERRSARRAVSGGVSSIMPLNLQGNSAITSGQDQVDVAQPVDTSNPQEMYSPSACVFVAK